MESDRFLQMV